MEAKGITVAELERAEPWNEEDFLALPETRQRVELLDGSLLMSPAPGSGHQQLARRLANILEGAAPTDLEVVEAVNVRVAPGRLLIPDVVVTARTGAVTVYRPADLLLVAEVVSPSTVAVDRLLKPELYAAAGIPWLLRVEPDPDGPPALWLFYLDGGVYTEDARAGGSPTRSPRAREPERVDPAPAASIVLPDPLTGTLDPVDLLRRRS